MKKRFTSGNYFQVSNYIFQFGLKPSSFVLYCYLKMRDNPERGCFPTKETISKDIGLSLTTVDNALKELKERGLVSVSGWSPNLESIQAERHPAAMAGSIFHPGSHRRRTRAGGRVRKILCGKWWRTICLNEPTGVELRNFLTSALAQKILSGQIFLRSQREKVVPMREFFSDSSLRNLIGTQKFFWIWPPILAADFKAG